MDARGIVGIGILAGGGYYAYKNFLSGSDEESSVFGGSGGFIGSGGASYGAVSPSESSSNKTGLSNPINYNYSFPSSDLSGFYDIQSDGQTQTLKTKKEASISYDYSKARKTTSPYSPNVDVIGVPTTIKSSSGSTMKGTALVPTSLLMSSETKKETKSSSPSITGAVIGGSSSSNFSKLKPSTIWSKTFGRFF